MKREFELIVFDWDGTLMDSEAKIVRCMTAAALDAGIPDPGAPAIRRIIGLGLGEAIEALLPACLCPQGRRVRLERRVGAPFMAPNNGSGAIMNDKTSETANGPSLARGPRLDPIGETANGPSLARGPRLDPIGEVGLHSPRPLRPPWMAEVRKTQEQFFRHWVKLCVHSAWP